MISVFMLDLIRVPSKKGCFHSNSFSFVVDVCREDCEIVQSMCPEWAQLVNRFLDPLPDKIRSLGLSSCENLPENDCTSLWPLSKYIHTGFLH